MIVIYILSAALLLAVLLLGRFYRSYRFPPDSVPQTLCFHKISRKFCFEGTWTTPNRFRSQMKTLLNRGYNFIDESSFLNLLDRRTGFNRWSVLLTFDDGYKETMELALPILEELDIPALVFLVAGYVGRYNDWDLSLGRRSFYHLTWHDAKRMLKKRITFGSHGLTHSNLTIMPKEKCEQEFSVSKRITEQNLGCEVRCFSYPFGIYNSSVKVLAARAGFKAAFSLYPAHADGGADRYALRRNGVYIIDSAKSVLAKLEPGHLRRFEDLKCRSINRVSVLTPALKNLRSHLDK